MTMATSATRTTGFLLQDEPKIFCATLSGKWLLEHTTPIWRIDDPVKGFQRIVREDRAIQIAVAVLNQRRTFPNAIVLATDIESIEIHECEISIPEDAMFLVIDGQHRLWAQKYSDFEASYGCMIHAGLSQEDMARLFLEINENQKRVPSSLRWDLVRLLQPEGEPDRVAAADIVYLLATEKESPFYQRIDLTGEQPEILIKQGSLAPEFSNLLRRRTPLLGASVLEQHHIILEYSLAIQQLDADRWGTRDSPYFKARVLRALFRLLADLLPEIEEKILFNVRAMHFIKYISKVDEKSLDPEHIRSMQGSAGMTAIYRQIRGQVFPT